MQQYPGGNSKCGYTTKYYAYIYPYSFMRMNHTYRSYFYYTYPTYYPNPVYQVTVSTNPAGLPVNGAGQYCANQVANLSVGSTTVSAGPGVQYVFSGWSGDYSGTNPTVQLTITGSKSIVANFKTQYMLTVNSQYSHATGSGWYDSGNNAYASLDATEVDLTGGSRVLFAGWSGDATGTSLPTVLTMNGPRTVTAQWKQQYYLSLSSPYGQTEGSGWYDGGSTVTINVNTPIPAGYGSQYVFDGWVGTSQIPMNTAQVTVNQPMSLIATWHLDRTLLYETLGLGAVGIVAILAVIVSLVVTRRRRLQQTPSKTSQ